MVCNFLLMGVFSKVSIFYPMRQDLAAQNVKMCNKEALLYMPVLGSMQQYFIRSAYETSCGEALAGNGFRSSSGTGNTYVLKNMNNLHFVAR